jgi:hypothetical protein
MSEWQPIDTYPPDRKNTLCYGGDYCKRRIRVWPEGTSIEQMRADLKEDGYTHWIETPSASSVDGRAES